MNSYCYINGKVIPESEASVISPRDIGLLRGFGIYEGIKTYNKKPFRLQDHLERFRTSAAALSLVVPLTDREIEDAIVEIAQKNGYEESNFRMILTGGITVGGIEFDQKKPTFYILSEEFKPLAESARTVGESVITFEHQRFMPHIKTIDYLQAVLLQKHRKEHKAIEILYHSKGKVLEAATSNFFIFKDNVLVTPKTDILFGITRKVVLEIAGKEFKIEEREVLLDELEEADEAFISASYKEIVPIIKIDDREVGDGKVGENTKRIMSLFEHYVKSL